MGLGCSGDEYNCRADMAFADQINTVCVVDDLLHFDDRSQQVAGYLAFSTAQKHY